MFYEPSTQKTYTSIQDFKLEYRDTSFGELDTEEERNVFGLFTIHDVRPTYDSKLQVIEEDGIVNRSGLWYKNYTVKDKQLSHEDRARIFNQRFNGALIALFDEAANERDYDTHTTCLMRAGYPNPWQKEAQAFGTWMDGCNEAAYKIMNQITVGEKAIPKDVKELISSFPKMVWPD